MFNRRIGLLTAGLTMGLALPVHADVQPAAPGLDHRIGVTKPKRSRGAQAKPKKRPNRIHISKRTRAKHRRKAKC